MRLPNLIVGLILGAVSSALLAANPQALRVEGTRLVVTDDQGREREQADLVGAELQLGTAGTLQVLSASKDPSARFDEVWLYQLQLRPTGALMFQSFCAPDPYGDTRVVVYQGYFDQDRRYVADATRFSLSCVSGVEAKCLRWGYLPWRTAPANGASLEPYYTACINMARADYCGNDAPSTRNGTAIDIYDRVGVQTSDASITDMAFEAGWNEHGAVCVAHTRIVENLTLDGLHTNCPRLAEAPSGADCDDATANTAGALLFNRSKLTASHQ
ncbi:hypothetical protein C7S18_18600 [Ahniella affigens]|uniref:ADYC domain-containing protein n=1 Tax=Ahniella affigens TaxID=2021234 RepID=A0A2P1PW23_9GAMM|nr:ADYC domain-containing protein [Ahniella affigens]AVP99057.1 hypothetical protein C7S18_18600 [Ahniella affigens]